MHLNLRLLAFFLGVLVIFGVFYPVQEASAITLSPLTFELIANPGDTINNVLRLTNDGDREQGIVMVLEDFVARGEEGQVLLEEPSEDNTYSLARWVTVNPRMFTLGARESRVIEFTINVPLDAEPGGHYSSILANVTAGNPQTSGVGIAQKIGALLLLNVAGDVREDINIVEFSAPYFSEYGPVEISARFRNSGTVHIKPAGFIYLKNMFGKEVAKLDLPQKNILPNSIRRIDTSLEKKNLFGRYEATLTSIYGSANEPLSAVTTFWVVPWKLVSGILIGVLILFYLVFKGRRRIKLALKILFKGQRAI
jgi:hypothetical protein